MIIAIPRQGCIITRIMDMLTRGRSCRVNVGLFDYLGSHRVIGSTEKKIKSNTDSHTIVYNMYGAHSVPKIPMRVLWQISSWRRPGVQEYGQQKRDCITRAQIESPSKYYKQETTLKKLYGVVQNSRR